MSKGFNNISQAPGNIEPTVMALPSGTRFAIGSESQSVSWFFDPWLILRLFGIDNLIASVTQAEVLFRPDAKYNIMRETLVNSPGVGAIGQRTVIEDNTITTFDKQNESRIRNQLRERNRFVLPISLILWIPSLFWSADPNLRMQIANQASMRGFMPTFTLEMFKKIRSGTIGRLNIIPVCLTTSWKILVTLNPELRNTFFDPAFLSSPTGIVAWFDLMQLVYVTAPDYLSFSRIEKATDIPQLFAAFTLTQTALSLTEFCESQIDFDQVEVSIIPGHSYGKNVEATHLGDIVIAQAIISTTTPTDILSSIVNLCPYIMVSNSSSSIASYIVQRALSMISNPFSESRQVKEYAQPSGTSDGSSAPTDDFEIPVTKSNRGQGGRRSNYNRNKKRDVSTSSYSRFSDEYIINKLYTRLLKDLSSFGIGQPNRSRN